MTDSNSTSAEETELSQDLPKIPSTNQSNSNHEADLKVFWEEKKSSFIKLKLWEDERMSQASKHRTLLECILGRIMQKANIGREANLATAKFLKERAQADLQYADILRSQLIYLPTPTAQITNNSLKSGLAAVNSVQNALLTKLKDFSQHIELDLLKNDLAEVLINYDSKIIEFHNRAEILKKELDFLNEKTIRSFKEHATVFRSAEIQLSSNGLITSCSWLSETRYLKQANMQLQLQGGFAVFVSTFWKETLELELQRIKAIKSTMKKFIEYEQEVFNLNAEEALQSLEDISEDLSKTMDSYKLLTPNEFETLRELAEPDEPLEALINWKLEIPRGMRLIVREGKLSREAGVFRHWNNCYVVATSDRFLHIFAEVISEEFSEPLISIFLMGAKILPSKTHEEYFIEIIEAKSQGFFGMLSAPRRTMLYTNNLEEMQDWVSTLNMLIK